MMALSNWDEIVWLAVLVYLLAGVVKGTIGLGLPTTAVGLMAQFTDARSAVVLVIIPMFVTNLWQVWRSRQVRWVLSQFWMLALSMMVMIAAFAYLAPGVSLPLVTLVLGIIVTLYAIVNLYMSIPSIPARLNTIAQITAGCSAGAMGGIAGVWAPPMLMYLSSRNLNKDAFVSTVGLLLLLGSGVLGLSYWNNGLLSISGSSLSLMLVLPAMLGFSIGERIRYRVNTQLFNRLVLYFYLAMGLNLVRRAVFSSL